MSQIVADFKQSIVAHYRELSLVAEQSGMSSLAADIRTTRIPKLENERFHLVILGEFNHGKSTFVNALIGAPLLPTGITPTTAAINHVVWAEEPCATAVLKDGESIPIRIDQVNNWVTVTGERSSDVAYVEIGYPAEILKGNITLVDTPGVNDLNEQRADITYGYVARADAVLFLLDAGQALKDSEREFLASHVLEGTRERLLFVLGKADQLEQKDRDVVLKYVKDGLATFVDQPRVFAISARAALEGDIDNSGMPQLRHELARFLDRDRARILLDNAAVDAARTASYLRNNLNVKRYSYDLDLGEVERKAAQIKQQLDASKRAIDALQDKITNETNAIKSHVRLNLEGFAKDFLTALPEQIDAVDANDVKKYLPGFIEDRFRQWAELEGAKLASMLERVAEDVIAVTNENVAAASQALAERIGPEDTAVDIEVDSFKYDVGVYAVGALGTTLFLFVNGLAGGLLTLTAPMLAIVFKSKIAGDIREQAKERVPSAIERTTEAMGPHFDKCIDNFAERLRKFVSDAGNTLYQGITEVLDQTMRERRNQGAEIANLKIITESQSAQVLAIRDELDQLREKLWQGDESDREN